MCKKASTILILILTITTFTKAQKLEISAGAELLRSFNHQETFWGYGATAQAHIWVREPLGLGIKTGYLNFSGSETILGNTVDVNYSAIPVLGVIRYPMPFLDGLYGQDALGFTFTQNAIYSNGDPVPARFTYYFSLGYVIKERIDIALKVGRSRFDKKNLVSNVNEQNIGLRVAYVF